jgi:GH24 family phage-related lysozyme (muramidase)
MTDALSVIKGFEGYIDHAKWDKTAYRAGYGSDTTTLADGTKVPITAGMKVTRDDSERDLARRAAEFEQHAAGQVGHDLWTTLPGNARAGLTSMTYNYGSLPHEVVAAAKTGDVNAIAQAVRGRQGDNGGENAGRRNKEADIISGPQGAADNSNSFATQDGSTKYTMDTEVPLNPNASVANTPRVDKPVAPSLWQTEKDAFNQNSTIALILNSNPYKADPNWVKPDEQKLAADLQQANLDPERYAKFLGGSTSQRGYMKGIQDAQDDRDRLARLSQAGLTGTALDFVNQALDPVNVATDLAVSAIAPEFTLGKYGVRVGKVLSSALAGGASGLATTAINYGFNPNATKADLMMGTVLGAGLGGLVGRLSRLPQTAPEARGLQDIGQRVIAEHEGAPHPGNAGSVGAAAIRRDNHVLDPDSAMAQVEHEATPRSAFAKVRGDIAAMFDKSKNPATRLTGSGLVQDGTGKIGGAINGRAASEDAAMLKQQFDGAFYRTWKPQKAAFLAKPGNTANQFDDLVFKYVEDTQLKKGDLYPPEVKAAGDAWSALRREQLKLQQNGLVYEGGSARPVQGSDKTHANENYMVHEWHPELIHQADEHFEDGTLFNVLKGSMRKANSDIAEDDLNVVAGAFLKSLKERGAGLDRNDFLARASGSSMEDAMQALVEQGALKQADKDKFMLRYEDKKAATAGDAGNAKPFKTRAWIDATYVLPYRPRARATGLEHDADFGVKDLMNRNIEYLNNKYSRRAAGNIALARMKLAIPDIVENGEVVGKGATVLDGITSDKEWSDHLDSLARRGVEAGQSPSEIASDRKRLQFAYDSIKGTKTYDMNSTQTGWALRQLRKFNFVRMMNQVGLAQLPELGNLVGSLGLKATIQQLPNMRRIIGADGVSHLKNGFGDDIEHIFGNGLESWTRTPEERYDAMLDMIHGTKGGTWQTKVSNLLSTGTTISAKISGMEGIDTLSKRWAYKAVVQRFANEAQGRGGLFKLSDKRLADLGLDKEMFGRVKTMLQDPNAVQMNGKRVAGLKMDQWADKGAAEAFKRAVYRKSSEIIQKNDLGNQIMWMGHPVAQTLTQFRTFMAASYVKQTMKALHMRDPEAAINASLAMTIGAMVYEVQTRENALGRSDSDKFLKDRLSWDKIIGAGFAKAGVSSIIPMLVDTTLPMAGYKQQFSYSRTTGQTSDLFLGNPGTGLIDDVTKAVGASRGLFSGDLSQEEVRAMNKLLPFNNAFIYTQGLNLGMNAVGLQERTPRSRKQLHGLFGDH